MEVVAFKGKAYIPLTTASVIIFNNKEYLLGMLNRYNDLFDIPILRIEQKKGSKHFIAVNEFRQWLDDNLPSGDYLILISKFIRHVKSDISLANQYAILRDVPRFGASKRLARLSDLNRLYGTDVKIEEIRPYYQRVIKEWK